MTGRTECEGCATLVEGGKCRAKPMNDVGQKCPCIICIVKTMCDRVCADYAVYRGLNNEYMEPYI